MLTNATQSISGRIVDANNSNIGLPALFVPVSANGLIGVGFTDANGNFTVPARAGQWRAGGYSSALIVHGYVGLDNDITVDTTAGSVSGVTIAVPKATALFYGGVKDNLNQPLAGVGLSAQDNNNQYQSEAITDQNGNYVAGALTGTWRIE